MGKQRRFYSNENELSILILMLRRQHYTLIWFWLMSSVTSSDEFLGRRYFTGNFLALSKQIANEFSRVLRGDQMCLVVCCLKFSTVCIPTTNSHNHGGLRRLRRCLSLQTFSSLLELLFATNLPQLRNGQFSLIRHFVL